MPYGAMRLRHVRQALRAFLARWGVYIAMAAAVFGAGASNALQLVMSAAACLVLPLFYAAAHGAWLLLALPLQMVFGAALVWAARQILWPARWGEAERALPISRAASLRSDAMVVVFALTPWLALQGAGAATLLASAPAWLRPVQLGAVLALLAAGFGSVALSVWGLQLARRAPGAGLPVWMSKRWASQAAAPAVSKAVARPLATQRASTWAWIRVMLWLPLWRGPARRTGRSLLGGVLLLLTPSGGLMLTHGGEPWWLALASLLSLAVCARIQHLGRLEFAGLHAAAAWLPISARALRLARQSLGLWPVLLGTGLLCASVLALGSPSLRPLVLLIWAALCLGSCLMQVRADPPQAAASGFERAAAGTATQDSNQALRWLFSLVVCVCVASEVLS